MARRHRSARRFEDIASVVSFPGAEGANGQVPRQWWDYLFPPSNHALPGGTL